MNGHIFREVRGVLVQEFSPAEGRVVGVRFHPDDGEHNSTDSVFDEIGFPAAPSASARKVLLGPDLRNLFIPRVLAQTSSSLVWQLDEGVVLVGEIVTYRGANQAGLKQELQQAVLVPVAEWLEAAVDGGRALDAWRRKTLKAYRQA